MKSIKAAVNDLEYLLHEKLKKSIRDNKSFITMDRNQARALLNTLRFAKSEIEEMEADQDPSQYAYLAS